MPFAGYFGGSRRPGYAQGSGQCGADFIHRASGEALQGGLVGVYRLLLLHRAGPLEWQAGDTHWNSLDRLKALGDVTVVEERFVEDGNIWSSAGVSASIDMVLAFIASSAGEEAASKTQAAAEYFPASTVYGRFHENPKAPLYLK